MDAIKLFLLKNWKTTLPALLALLCLSDSEFWHTLPAEWQSHMLKFCVLMNTVSALFAKDADKTHAQHAVQPQTAPEPIPDLQSQPAKKEGV